jgi:GTP cyclohydrolase IV
MSESRHFVALALGSNLGDRQGNLASALQHLRSAVNIQRISSLYETAPVGFAQQPDFLNLACVGTTALAPRELHDATLRAERFVGRAASFPMGPRAIDIDILFYDDLVLRDAELAVPHPRISERAFVLVPLAEIAADLVHPVSRRRIGDLAAEIDARGVRRCDGGLVARIRHDVQAQRPDVPLALNRAGVSGVKTILNVAFAGSRQTSAVAVIDVFADLDATHSGVHMSRFSQDLEDALADIAREPARAIDSLAVSLAERVVQSQKARFAHVEMRAEIALPRYTPASAIPTHEFYDVRGIAVVGAGFRRSLLGVEAEGITACPCAQSMVAEQSRERLLADGFSDDQVRRVLETVPIATHNQRSRGTLLIGGAVLDVPAMVEIVEQSMSSETYDLLKRPDELFVVNKAHRHPRFVEDCVREMLAFAHEALADAPDDAFVLARQVNFESIHKHDAVAESCAALGELRRELRGETGVSHTTLEQWLHVTRPDHIAPNRM